MEGMWFFGVFFAVFFGSIIVVSLIRILFRGLWKLIGYFAMREANRDPYFNREYARPRSRGTLTTYHGFDNYQRYIMGEISLEEWHKSRKDTEVREIDPED